MRPPGAKLLMWERERRADDSSPIEATGPIECFRSDSDEREMLLLTNGTPPAPAREERLEVICELGDSSVEAGPIVFAIGLDVPKDWAEELAAWYRHEHGPILLECSDWSGFVIARNCDPGSNRHYVLHRLRAKQALVSKARARARSTPWFMRMQNHEWFQRPFMRTEWHRTGFFWL